MTTKDSTALNDMQTLGELTAEAAALVRDMAEGRDLRARRVTDYSGRTGFQPTFLKGFRIALPSLGVAGRQDIAPLLDGSGSVIPYEHFSVVMSKSRRLAYFVACNIDGEQSYSITRTNDPWQVEPRIDTQYQCGADLYRDNHLDRGHLVRREDPVWGATKEEASRAEVDTFHYTNCTPQIDTFNQHVWLGLEDYILRNARAERMRVSVFTGPVFRADDPEHRGVRLPREYWKVVAVKTGTRPSATAYMLSQAELLDHLRGFAFGQYKTYQVSIAHVEQLTTLSFGTLRRYDGFSTEETRKRALTPMRVELRSWKDIRI
ncbi:MAG: DNA/RNA non-specific endonuclease [Nitrospiraceae bacterium]